MKRKITALVLSMTMVLSSAMISSHANVLNTDASKAVPNNVEQANNEDKNIVLNDLIEQVDGKYKDSQKVTVIVEVNDENMSKEHGISVPDITKVRTKEGLEDQVEYAKKSQDVLISEMDEAGVSYQIEEVYDTVLNGIAVSTTLEDAKKIATLGEVKSIELNRTIEAPKLESNNYKTLDETSNGMVKATEAWSRNYSGKGQLIAILDSGTDPDHEIFQNVDETSLRIKSEAETSKLIREKGVDSGKYFNKKIPFGYNYADKNANIKEDKVQSHGMHVAGIVAANGEKLKGVAPNAQLAIMRVFGQSSIGTTPMIYNKAIDDAVKMGVDSINMSLGSTGTTDGRMEQTTINALRRAQEAGIVVAIAIGNDGFMGFGIIDGPLATNPDIGLTNSPGVADLSLAVASVDNVKIKQKGILLNTDPVTKILFQASDDTPFPTEFKNFVHVNEGYAEDFQGVELTGKIALIKRGDKPDKKADMSFAQKVKNAQDKGAIAAIVYNNVDEQSLVHMAGFKEAGVTIPSCFISKKDGELMIANPDKTVKVDTEESYLDNPNAYKVSVFSSWGVTPEGNLKPDISAPGGQIYSSLNNNNYGLMSGTSMATPHVAGGIAVVKEYVEKTFPSVTGSKKHQLIKNLLMSTAVPYSDKSTGAFTSPRSQGAGLMNLNRAISSSVVAIGTNNISSINLRNIKGNDVNISGKLKNYSDQPKTFEYYAQLNTDMVENGRAILQPKKLKDTKDNKKSITVPANSEADFNVTFNLSDEEIEELKKDRPNGFFLEGYVVFEMVGSELEEISIPFVGFRGDWNSLQVIEDSIYDMVSQGKRPTYYEVSDRTQYPFTHILSKSEGKDVLLGEDPTSTYKEPKFDKNKIAFSPNGDGRAEEIQFVGTFLRNYKDVSIEVYTQEEKDNPIYSFKIADDHGTKNYFISGFGGPNLTQTKTHWKWDGKSASSEAMKDGNYIFTINVKADGTDDNIPNQKMEFPVTIDTVYPRIVQSSYDQSKGEYKLTKVDETGSGIRTQVIKIGDKEYTPNEEGVFKLPENTDPKTATITISDYAYNTISLRLDNSLRRGDEKTVMVSPVIATGSVPANKFKWLVFDAKGQTVNPYNLQDGDYTLQIYDVEDPFELAEESNMIKFTIGKDDKDKIIKVRFNYKNRKQVTMEVTKPRAAKLKIVAIEYSTGNEYEAIPIDQTHFSVNLPPGTYVTRVRDLDEKYFATIDNAAFVVGENGIKGINPKIFVSEKRMRGTTVNVDRGDYTGAFKLIFKGDDALKSTYELEFASGESTKNIQLPIKLPFKVYIDGIEGYAIGETSYTLSVPIKPLNITLVKGGKIIPVPVEKSELSILVNKAKTLIEDDYQSEGWGVFEKALDKAEKILNDEKSTQIQVNGAVKELQKAMDELIFKDSGDKKRLKAKLEEAEDIYNRLDENYTDESKEFLKIAIDASRIVLDSNEPKYNTKRHIDDMIDLLNRAIKNLTRKDGKVNKLELEQLIKQSEELIKNKELYTEDSIKELEGVYNDAKEVFENTDASAKDVQRMEGSLKTYIDNVVSRADRAELQKEVDTSSKIDLTLYNIEGKSEFRAALQKARDVLANKRALQNEIDDAKNKLKQAREALVLKGQESKEIYNVPVQVKEAGSQDISLANDFVESSAKAEKIKDTENYRYTITVKPVGFELNNKNITAEVSNFVAVVNGREVQVTKQNAGSAVQYVFEAGRVENLEALFTIDVLQELSEDAVRGNIVFDWANATK